MTMVVKYLVAVLFVVCVTPNTAVAKATIGWLENVAIYPGNLPMQAKIDSGANTSSLHCNCSAPFYKNGEQWVKFEMFDRQGKTVPIERKISGEIKIKRHFGESQKRLVVRMGICIGNYYAETDVNLIDRSGFKYPLLIGRDFLEKAFLIDPQLTFTSNPQCDNVIK